MMKVASFALLLVASCYATAFSPVHRSEEWAESRPTYSCKCYEGDACWPSIATWTALNATVGGRLLKFVPHQAVCHNTFEGINTFNAAGCAVATKNQDNQEWL